MEQDRNQLRLATRKGDMKFQESVPFWTYWISRFDHIRVSLVRLLTLLKDAQSRRTKCSNRIEHGVRHDLTFKNECRKSCGRIRKMTRSNIDMSVTGFRSTEPQCLEIGRATTKNECVRTREMTMGLGDRSCIEALIATFREKLQQPYKTTVYGFDTRRFESAGRHPTA